MTSTSLIRCLSKNVNIIKRSYSVTNISHILAVNRIQYNQCINNTEFQKPISIARFFATNDKNPQEDPKPGLLKRFKQMYRDYWYVLVPVHLITSAGWFGGFYYLAKSGVDVGTLLQSMGCSEKITTPLKDSSMGYLAISYALYKIATPFRYTVTLGGTTISINYLKEWGYIKPVPSKDKLKEMYKEQKEHLRETIQETKEELRQRKDQLRERKDNIIGDYANFKQELKDIKTKNVQKVISNIKQK